MNNQLKKQKIYFVSLGLLGIALISSLVLLSLNTKEQSLVQGSLEGSLSQCLKDCSKEELVEKLKQIQIAINNKDGKKPVAKVTDKLQITASPEKFKKQLDSLEVELNKLDKKSDKIAKENYNQYLVALLKKFTIAKTNAIKKLKVAHFESDEKKAIEKYINLNINLNQIKDFLLDHISDLSMYHPTEEQIDRLLSDNRVDQELLAALLTEHQSRSLAKKAKEEQSKNTDNPVAQMNSNNDVFRSISLHQQAQNYIFSLKRHKQNGAFNKAENKWVIDQIDQAEKYIASSEKFDIKSRNTHHSNTNTNNIDYSSGGSFSWSSGTTGYQPNWPASNGHGPFILQGYGGFFPKPSHRKRKDNNKNSDRKKYDRQNDYQNPRYPTN